MGDTLKAFIEFLVDIFSALSTFLGGGDFDLSGMLNSFLGGEEETNTDNSTDPSAEAGD